MPLDPELSCQLGCHSLMVKQSLELNRRTVAKGQVRIEQVVVLLDPRPDPILGLAEAGELLQPDHPLTGILPEIMSNDVPRVGQVGLNSKAPISAYLLGSGLFRVLCGVGPTGFEPVTSRV